MVSFDKNFNAEQAAKQRAKVQAFMQEKAQLAITVEIQCRNHIKGLAKAPNSAGEDNLAQVNKIKTSTLKRVLSLDSEVPAHVVLLPANTNTLSLLPDKRKAEFISHLTTLYWAVQANEPLPNHPYAEQPPLTLPEQETALLGQACALCKGFCCGLGASHAFQDYASLAYFLAEQMPTLTLDELTHLYAGYFPTISYQDACVFQSEQGCTLPNNLRSFTCNNYMCKELEGYSQKLTHDDGVVTFAASVDGRKIQQIGLFDENGIIPITD
jgi:hypothetical protein